MNPASKKSVLVLAALGVAALAAASYGAYWWHTGRFMQTTDDAYVGGDISAISSKVSGYIQQLAVQDNMAVKKGDLLIRIDDRDYRAALAKAAGEVAAQQAALADILATRQLQQATIAGSAASLLAATAATENWLTTTDAITPWPRRARFPHRSAITPPPIIAGRTPSRRRPKRIKPWPNVSWRCWMLASSKPWLPWRRPRLTSRWPG